MTYGYISSFHTQTPEINTYDIQWTRFIYLSTTYRGSASYEIREQTDFPHLGSSGATVKAGVTKDDAWDLPKRHAIFPKLLTPSTIVLPKKERPYTTHRAPRNPITD